MEDNTVLEKIIKIFKNVFDDEELEITEFTTPEDIEYWDSLNHLRLINEVEKTFSIKIKLDEAVKIKSVEDGGFLP